MAAPHVTGLAGLVTSLEELLRTRDGLRAAGLDATTIAVLDPGTLGDGSDADPA